MAYIYPQNIFDAIRQERQDFLYNFIEIVDGFTFNQYNTIKKIHKYYNSHYNDGDYETVNGVTRKKVFWNIGKRRATIATKQIDIDTKDFLLISEKPETEWNVDLLEKELKAWMKRSKYGKILNQIAEELPVYGSCVLRKTKEGAELCDLRYLFCEQSAASLKDSRYLIIKHLMTPEQLREMTEWENTDEAIEKFAVQSSRSYETTGQINIQHTTPQVEVFERFAEVPRSYLENDGALYGDGDPRDKDFTYARYICAGIDNLLGGSLANPVPVNPQNPAYAPGVILFKEEIKKEDQPFKEVHFRKTRGRWLGIGIIEDTFEDQRMVNKVKDQEDKAAEHASIIVYQTAQDMIAKNVLTDIDNGEILKASSPITRLDNNLHQLGEMQRITEAYELHADRETFSADLLGGEQPPASATLGAVKTQVQASASVYDYKKENFGLFLQEFIQDLVFPEAEQDLMKPHAFAYTGNIIEMNKVRERAARGYIRMQIFEGKMDVPTKEQEEALVQQIVQSYQKAWGSKFWLDVQKEFFKNVKNGYEVSLEITGEGKNVQVWLQNLDRVLQVIERNPMAIQNPLTRRLLYKMLTAMGMSMTELENAEAEMTQEMVQSQMQAQQQNRLTEAINFKDLPPQGQQQLAQKAGIQLQTNNQMQ